MNDALGLREIVLDRKKVLAQQLVTRRVLREAKVSVIEDLTMDNLIFQLEAHVLSDHFADERVPVTFAFPASPWQFFKESVFPEWLERKFPVSYRNYTRHVPVSTSKTFPESEIAYPESLGPPRIVQEIGEPVGFNGVYDRAGGSL